MTNFVTVMNNWQQNFVSSNSVCNHSRDPATPSPDYVNHLYDYRPNWIPLSPFTIIN